MTDNNAHINYSFADIQRYLNGGMTAKEMHDLERAALQDPFLADAIEGYQNSDADIANQHLNEIAATLQKEEPAKVILMPEKKQYGWLIAASLLAVIGTGIFLFTGENQSKRVMAVNTLKKNNQVDSFTESSKPAVPKPNLDNAVASNESAVRKPEQKENSNIAKLEKKSSLINQKKPSKLQPESAEIPQTAMVYTAPSIESKITTEQKQPAPVHPDSTADILSAQSNMMTYAKRQTKTANTWTTDKGKPFLLSEVEVINMDKKDRKPIDTSAVKPEGGWQSFQEYLFSRLSRKDSLLLTNKNSIPDNLELEFSIDQSGLPYDIKVFHARDSITTNKIINAVQSGPKWISSDTKEKRLRLRY